jgi:hypothetical protein
MQEETSGHGSVVVSVSAVAQGAMVQCRKRTACKQNFLREGKTCSLARQDPVSV